MNKTAIKNFAIWARNKLIADIQYRAGLMGITAGGIKDALPQSTATMEFYDIGTTEPYSITGNAIQQRKKLVEIIRQKEKDSDYSTAYKYILEEVAYTWFNRLIAIRFMEVNDYLPSHIRVLSSESGKVEPDLVTTPFDAELKFTPAEEETILRLKTDNALDELFRLLFIKQCNALNEILPTLFEKTSDYTELLLNLSVVDQDGVVYHLIHDIDEADFNIEKGGQVEIIGWLYQYYNTEPKNTAFAKNGKITKEEIPAVTQLFTPDWIVRYMVENSLGRIFIDKRNNEGVFADERGPDEMSLDEAEAKRIANEEAIAGQMGWKYYLPEAAQTLEVRKQLDEIQRQSEYKNVRDIKVIDPCMGSGHILVYTFDVLMQMYENEGYSQRDAARSILENNLYGLDIDDRAYQLAYFAIMMKARQYDRRIFSRGIQPHIHAIIESNAIGGSYKLAMGDFLLSKEHQETLNYLLDTFLDAKEFGSILQLEDRDYTGLMEAWKYTASQTSGNFNLTLWFAAVEHEIPKLIEQAIMLTQKYDVVVTNPPYMRSSGMSGKLSEYVKKNYPDSKADMFAIFIERCGRMTAKNRYQAMITQHAWMFLSSFEKLRIKLLMNDTVNMVHLGARAFEEIGGEVVQTTSFVMRKSHVGNYKGIYCRLIEPTTQQGKETMFLTSENRYIAQQSNFSKIPGAPVAYWLNYRAYHAFENGLLSSYANTRQGFKTGDNNTFLRLWFECDISDESFSGDKTKKWFPCTKGGEFRRWYGNFVYVVNWENDGYKLKHFVDENGKLRSRPQNLQINFTKQITWTSISSGNISFRLADNYFMYESKGPVLTPKAVFDLILAYVNSKVYQFFISIVAPTLDYSEGAVLRVPYLDISASPIKDKVKDVTSQCVLISRYDWDAFETSWDFVRHPLVEYRHSVSKVNALDSWCLKNAFEAWEYQCQLRFDTLKSNEEKLNCIFIDIYGLQDELSPEVEDRDVTVRKADLQRDIKSLLSYAIGCMFGRYSLDMEGLAYAGGEWDESKYKTFLPDVDGILPITDEEYLEDDIVSRLCDWLKVVYGEATLEENLDFIAKALGAKGGSSRESIRNYFIKDFFKDHCKIYQKRPIYWLFDSGKQNGFKALIYLHRYTPDTIGNLRVDYLHKMQRVYESEIGRMQDMIDHSTNAREVAAATKRKEKLQKQLKECRDYDEMIGHLALSRIELDLDDGVKVNYRKMQTAADGKFFEVLADSKSIMAKEK